MASRFQNSEVLTGQFSRANEAWWSKILSFASPEKKRYSSDSERPSGVLGLSGGEVANADS